MSANILNPRSNSKEKILQIALELFSQNGYEKTSIREIAKTAGISLGLLYNYFDGKEALLKAIVQDGISDIQKSFAFKSEEKNKLEVLIKKTFAILKKKKKHWRLLHSIRMQDHLSEKLGQDMEEINNDFIAELSMILQELHHEQPMQEAVLLYATIDGIASHYLTNEKYPLDKMIRLLIERYRKII